jgi:hypothetical protein
MPSKRETAWELDEDRVAGSADGSYLGGIPGLWFPGEAIHPEALGFGVEEFRELVRDLDLPLREVKVGEGKAARAADDGRLDSSPVGALQVAVAAGQVDDASAAIAEPEGPTIGDDVQMDELRERLDEEAGS